MRGRLAAMIAAVLVSGVVSSVIVAGREDGYPSEWDPRVQAFVDYVEAERGHDFDHAVPVDFLSEEEYSELTRADASELDETALAELDQAEGLLRALGLVTGEVDLFEATNDLTDSGTLAFYDPEAERIVVRGTEIDDALGVTLVHELTHALQDQAFDLSGLTDEDATSGALLAFRALVEGDALRIDQRYADEELSDEQRAAIDALDEAGLDALEDEGIPEAMQAFFGLPYALGDPYLRFLDAVGGDDAIDGAFEEPPTTEEHLVDPRRDLDGDEPIEVDRPEVDEAEVLDEGDFGAASLFLVLAQRIDLGQALTAVDGWGGDAYVAFERDDRSCTVIDVVGDHASDTDELRTAFDAWVAAGPAGTASVSFEDEVVRLDACDPGTEAPPGSASPVAALTLLASRSYIAADGVANGFEPDFAWCYGDGIVRALTLEELQAETLPADFEARSQPILEGCS